MIGKWESRGFLPCCLEETIYYIQYNNLMIVDYSVNQYFVIEKKQDSMSYLTKRATISLIFDSKNVATLTLMTFHQLYYQCGVIF